MYSIENGLGKKWKPLAVAFACFAVISSFGSGNAVQSFTVADQFRQDLGVPTWVTGLILATLVAAVILGGIRRIGRVTSKLVPFMAATYLGASLIVVLLHIDQVPGTLALIVTSAFQPAAQIGGFAGGTFIFMLTWGVKRGLFSNESGQGSAPIAHAAAKTDEPIREGVVAMIGPFIDTLLICTMTGLVILISGVWHDKQEQQLLINEQSAVVAIVAGANVQVDGEIEESELATGAYAVREGSPVDFALVRNHALVDDVELLIADDAVLLRNLRAFTGSVSFESEDGGRLEDTTVLAASGDVASGVLVLRGKAMQNGSPLTAWAFREGLGRVAFGQGHLLVTMAVFFFGLSTAISWSYYGDRSILYLAGPRWVVPYRVVFCIAHFLGAVYSLELVWAFGDMALGSDDDPQPDFDPPPHRPGQGVGAGVRRRRQAGASQIRMETDRLSGSREVFRAEISSERSFPSENIRQLNLDGIRHSSLVLRWSRRPPFCRNEWPTAGRFSTRDPLSAI